MSKHRDFGGWATKFNIKCADGRTIRDGAFDECDGKKVPLVWNHKSDSPLNVLGHAILHCIPGEGVYADMTLNNTVQGQSAREYVKNGDINALSIFANNLKQVGGDVTHGIIREVSLVLAGANPGAIIDTAIAHSEDGEPIEVIVLTDEQDISFDSEDNLSHSDEGTSDDNEDSKENPESSEAEPENESEEAVEHSAEDKTVGEVLETLTEEQAKAVDCYVDYKVEQALAEKESKEEDNTVKHNVFDSNSQGAVIAHALTKDEQHMLIEEAKENGASLKATFLAHRADLGIEGNDDIMIHSYETGDIDYSQDVQNYGVNDPSFLFPQPRALNNPPAWIKRDTSWVASVINGVKKFPYSRIKSVFADITEDEARAKGYIKGDRKVEEVFTLLRRKTEPQTIYKKQAMDRDDIIDITDFDVVAWIKGEMRIMLEEEIGRAILIGDGRSSASREKINEINIRPIWTDDDLFTIKYAVEIAANASDDDKANAYIKAAVKARKNYKGSGNPVFYTTEDVLCDMLLVEDNMGRRKYNSEQDLAVAMRVSRIVTVEVMEGAKRTVSEVERTLVGLIVNLSDYGIGADKGGAVSMFEDFDIDFNKEKYLIETRCSGALIKPYSAIAIESYVAS
jgi:HK97 family phage prohead protease